MTPARGLALIVALLAALAAFVALRARSNTAAWWGRVERICACREPALVQLDDIARVGAGGLDRVASAQRRVLVGECVDMRAAMTRRTWIERARDAPLRVTPGREHREAARDVARTMGLLCGDEHRAFWAALRARLDGTVPGGAPADPLVARGVREHLRIRDAMCARRAVLSAPPGSYTLTKGDAERTAAQCR